MGRANGADDDACNETVGLAGQLLGLDLHVLPAAEAGTRQGDDDKGIEKRQKTTEFLKIWWDPGRAWR